MGEEGNGEASMVPFMVDGVDFEPFQVWSVAEEWEEDYFFLTVVYVAFEG